MVTRAHDEGKTQGVRTGTDALVAIDLLGLHVSGALIQRAPPTEVIQPKGLQRTARDWWIPPAYINRIYNKKSGRNYFTNRHLKWERRITPGSASAASPSAAGSAPEAGPGF